MCTGKVRNAGVATTYARSFKCSLVTDIECRLGDTSREGGHRDVVLLLSYLASKFAAIRAHKMVASFSYQLCHVQAARSTDGY